MLAYIPAPWILWVMIQRWSLFAAIILVAAQGYTRPAASLRPAVPIGCRPFVAWHFLMLGIWCVLNMDSWCSTFCCEEVVSAKNLTLKQFWNIRDLRSVVKACDLLRCLASLLSQGLRSGMVWCGLQMNSGKNNLQTLCVCVCWVYTCPIM